MKQTSFIRLIKRWGILFLLTIGLCMVSIDLFVSYSDFKQRTDQMRSDYINAQKDLVKEEVTRVVSLIEYERNQSELITKETIQKRVYEAHAIVVNLFRRYEGKMTKRELQQLIVDAIRPIRYANGLGYFFMTDMKGNNFLNSSKPQNEGTNILGTVDLKGTYVVRQFIKMIESRGEGFINYYWKKPDLGDKEYLKISFAKHIKELDWYIGTGLYVDDIDLKVRDKLLENISRIRFGKEGYIFVNKYSGQALVSNGKRVEGDKYLWEVFNKNPEKTKGIFEQQLEAIKKPGGDYIYYSLIKMSNTEKESPKTSFIFGIPELHWIIGAGVYLDDVEEDIQALLSELISQFRYKLFLFVLLTSLIIIVLLVLFNRLNLKLAKDIGRFNEFLKSWAFSNESIQRDKIRFDELDQMAVSANKMLHNYHNTRDELKLSEERFRGLIESSSDWVWETNTQGEFVYVSPRVEEILGYSSDEFIGKRATPFIVEEEREGTNAELDAYLKDETKSIAFENQFVHKDGSIRVIESSAVPFYDAKNQFMGYRGFGRDATERKIAQEEIIKLNESLEDKVMLRTRQLERVNEELNDFAYIVSHDLKAPLRGIGQLVGWFSADYKDLVSEEGKETLRMLNERVKKMANLIDGVLQYSRAGRDTDTQELTSISKCINDSIAYLSISDEVEIKVLGDFPDLYINPIKIEQVFQNLITNAIEYNPKAKKEVRIQLSEEEKEFVFSISDNGEGIEEKYHEKIFKAFTSLDKKNPNSSGIGLSIVHKIINAYQGKVWLSSKKGEGTSFFFSLPKGLLAK